MYLPFPVVVAVGFLAGSPVMATNPPASAADNEAAAKHAKLTACLTEAKVKKLTGAHKAAFIKECQATH